MKDVILENAARMTRILSGERIGKETSNSPSKSENGKRENESVVILGMRSGTKPSIGNFVVHITPHTRSYERDILVLSYVAIQVEIAV